MKPARAAVLSVLAGTLLAAAPLLLAQEQPLVAGADGVPVPKKTKVVKPVYPAEALAQGLRGIVILDLLIDPQGHVASTAVVRSVSGLDEAAIAAARQWEFEPTKVAGKAVSVRLTVPITFTLALPTLVRDSGIPELRQGIPPAFPQGAEAGLASAEVTLEGDGHVGAARIVEGQEPWAGALLAALQTWRFSPPPEDASLSFRVEAQFSPSRGGEPARVALKASGLQRSDLLTSPPAAAPSTAATPATPATPPTPAGSDATPATTKTAQNAPAPQTPPAGAPAAPGSTPDSQPPRPPATAPGTPGGVTPGAKPPVENPPVAAPPVATPPVATPPVATPPVSAPASPAAAATPGRSGAPAPEKPATDRTAPPPVEVITAPAPQLPPENGVSAIRDVTLEPGVPDLTRGRRPVSPPLARMAGATGTVDVAFSVGAAGTTLVQSVSGPDLLKKAAEQAVASWVFRRTRADRAYLTATFDFAADKTAAVVRSQPAPANAPAAVAPTTPRPAAQPPTQP